jgi:hypothetical protein
MISKLRRVINFTQIVIFNGRNYDIEKSAILFFCHDNDRGVNFRTQAYSPLIDSIRDELELLNYKCQSIAHWGSKLVGKRAFGRPISINRIIFFGLLKKKLFGKESAIKNIYRRILLTSQANLIITIGSPSDLSSAARELGVLHVEILHGIGYPFLPWGWGDLEKEQLPQGIFSLDRISTEAFSLLDKHQITIKTIPHPFLKRFTKKRKNDIPDEWTIDLPNEIYSKKRILVSLTWGYAGDHGESIEFKNILVNGLFFPEVEELVSLRRDIFWFFRLHPLQLRDSKYRRIIDFLKNFVSKNNNCAWEKASYLPYPTIAMLCSGNIGMNSMGCYDAAAMGVPTLMLCPTVQPGNRHGDRFLDLIEEGYVTKALPNLEVINEWVDRVEPKQPRLSNLEDDAAWDEALQWMLEESGLKPKVNLLHE